MSKAEDSFDEMARIQLEVLRAESKARVKRRREVLVVFTILISGWVFLSFFA